MYKEIEQHPAVWLAIAVLAPGDRDQAVRALRLQLGHIGTAKVDGAVHELIGGPRRAPHWRQSRAALLRKDARRREATSDPSWGVFAAAATAASEVDGDD